VSRSRKDSDEAASPLSDFLSEDQDARSRLESGALTSDFVSEDFVSEGNSLVAAEGDGASLFPLEPDVEGAGVPLDAERQLVVAGETRVGAVGAKSFAPVTQFLGPLAIAVVAVVAVERVTMWKVVPVATPTETTTAAATEPPTAATASPTENVKSAPAAPDDTLAAQHARALAASRQPASTERAIVSDLRSRPTAQPALNARPALIGTAASAPSLLGIAAKAPSIEMLAPALPAASVVNITPVPAPAAPVAVDAEALDRAAIDRVLGVYQQSYSALDAEMVSTIWRGLDTRGLQRAFDGLDSQRMSFDHCEVTVDDDKARASCTGVLDYVRKIGQTNPLQKRLSWNFDLQRTDDRWLISKVDAR
jgi:hypothetical protein